MARLTEARVARVTQISVEQLRSFADHAEQRSRELMAQGMPLAQAVEQAADETVAIARACGVQL